VHFALQVDEPDFDALVDMLRSKDLEVPVHEFGGLGDVEAPSRSAYVTDPDGHLVEFWTARMSAYG
jgi:catechol 2,3-dioxygenase-like lactoylglutathione lyase family enzyme